MTAIATHPHRVTSAVAEARASIGSVADIPAWSMDPIETAAAPQELNALPAQVAELQARPSAQVQPENLSRPVVRVSSTGFDGSFC